MLDIKFIRDNLELVKKGADKKHIKVDLDRLVEVDDERKELLQKVEEKRAEQNKASDEIAKGVTDHQRYKLIDKMKVLKEELQAEETKLRDVMKEWQGLMLTVPNIPDVSVPEGKDDADNKEIKVWGEKPNFTFEPKNHINIMTELGMADFDRGAKVAGFRGYFLAGSGALLSYALWHFISDHFARKEGFTPMLVPSLVRKEGFIGTGFLPQSEEDLYKTQDDEYLSGTAEVATMAYHMDEVLDAKRFPIKYFSFSTAYRREAGAHGKDTKGLVRVHEFHKFEQVILCEASHEKSVEHHEKLTQNAEEILQLLKIPYHVVINCAGDLGLGQVKKYDIECWMPSEGKYRETHSSSYFHDFQTRRLNIRYRDGNGKLRYAHSLNNTALATPRFLAVLIENYQQADGSVKVPDVLVPYLGTKVITKRP